MSEMFRSLPFSRASYGEGQHLFHRGDRIASMYFVETGCACLVRRQPDGASLILQRAVAGTVLAEASLFATAYHCDAVASTPTTVRIFSRRTVLRQFQTSPEFAQAWVSYLSAEVRNARRRAEILSLRTVAARLDAWLSEFGDLPEKGGWNELAHEIGTSPEALYREIAKRR